MIKKEKIIVNTIIYIMDINIFESLLKQYIKILFPKKVILEFKI